MRAVQVPPKKRRSPRLADGVPWPKGEGEHAEDQKRHAGYRGVEKETASGERARKKKDEQFERCFR